MIGVDIAHLRQWVGRETWDADVLSVRHAQLMAATLGLNPAAISSGISLPPLWHWIYFTQGLPPSELGRDGHPERGGFLPPVLLPNRMWAGGRVDFFIPLLLGASVEKHSQIVRVEHKQGRSGELVFVTVRHDVLVQGEIAISEHHDIVYKGFLSQQSGQQPTIAPVPPVAHYRRHFEPTSTTLFRYSALTFNGHRIHYDVDYCREVEGYSNLVIHGPLLATLLSMYLEEVSGRKLKAFNYRGIQAGILGGVLSVNANLSGDEAEGWVAMSDGRAIMKADASFV